jgi:hypothetical protein
MKQVELIESRRVVDFYIHVYRHDKLFVLDLAIVALRNFSIKVINEIEFVAQQGLFFKLLNRLKSYDWASFQSVCSLLLVWYMFVGVESAILLGQFSGFPL